MKPYYNKSYNDTTDNYAPKLFAYRDLKKYFAHLLKFNLDDDKESHRYSYQLEMLIDTVGRSNNFGSMADFHKKVETAMDLINAAFSKKPELVTKIFEITADRLSDYEEEVHYVEETFRKTKQGQVAYIRKFKAMFDLYVETYRDYYSIASTIPAFCKEIIAGTVDEKTDINEYLQKESKYKIEKLDSPIILHKHPTQTLTEGGKRHIRNAISHEHRHKFIDETESVQLIDINLSGVVTYNRVFTLREFEQVLNSLRQTVHSMRTAMIIFNTNEIKTMKKYFSKKPLGSKKVEKIVYVCAKDCFLDLESMKMISSEEIEFVVKKQDRKPSEYFVGVGPLVKKVDIKPLPPATHQLARFLQMVYITTGKMFKRMKVTLLDKNGYVIGYIETKTANFSHKTAEDFLKSKITNTIPADYKLEG